MNGAGCRPCPLRPSSWEIQEGFVIPKTPPCIQPFRLLASWTWEVFCLRPCLISSCPRDHSEERSCAEGPGTRKPAGPSLNWSPLPPHLSKSVCVCLSMWVPMRRVCVVCVCVFLGSFPWAGSWFCDPDVITSACMRDFADPLPAR